jgi:hypothetical protein
MGGTSPLGVVVAVGAALMSATAAGAQAPTLPANDFEALLSAANGQFVEPSGPVQEISRLPLVPVPRAKCGTGSRPLPGTQGRVTAEDAASPEAAMGWTCNVSLVGHHSTPGGFRTWRYEDEAGHVCGFYDTSLVSRAGVISYAGGPSPGVTVLDMADPAHPKQTATLTTNAMLAPHESLNLNTRRGLLGAEVGNGATLPSSFAIYDVSEDCRQPVLRSEMPVPNGHESGFSPDGNTFWAAGGGGTVTAIDVQDPKLPHVVWTGDMYSHGLSLSDDGNTLYQTDPINGNLGILDVSQVQARQLNPTVREISRVTWPTVSVPQNSVPLTIKGHPYLLEFDEFAFRFNPATSDDQVGAARLIDIADPARPKVTSDLRLEVNMREVHQQTYGDPYPLPQKPLGYGGHYCAAPREVDPEIVACGFLNSGLRVFDVRDPAHPREVAYYVSPPNAGQIAGENAGDLAFSQPAFDPERREVWYTDATSGFYVLELDKAVWPHPIRPAQSPSCKGTTRHVALGRGRAVVRVTLSAAGERLRSALVRLRGPGFSRRAKTNRRGRVAFTVRSSRRGRATVRTPVCGARMRITVQEAVAQHRPGARFTG